MIHQPLGFFMSKDSSSFLPAQHLVSDSMLYAIATLYCAYEKHKKKAPSKLIPEAFLINLVAGVGFGYEPIRTQNNINANSATSFALIGLESILKISIYFAST